MTKHLRTVLAVAGLAAVPALASAQAHAGMAMGSPEHEVGLDLVAFFQSQSASGASQSGLVVKTPVDVRLGFVSHSNMMWEMRTTLSFSTTGTTTYNIDPGVNVLFKLGQSTAMNNNNYFTVGADAQYINNGAANNNTGLVPAINAGVGMRRPYGDAAWRVEAGFRYVFKNTNVHAVNEIEVGIRAGLSLWH